MKSIKWSRTNEFGCRHAIVEGVTVCRIDWSNSHSLEAGVGKTDDVIIHIPRRRRGGYNQISAAAYALARLVATLRGME